MYKAKKHLGQNFLINKKIINKIVNSIGENKLILEIGSGKGALTKELIKVANKLLAFEIDKELVIYLSDTIHSQNLTLINQDFLKFNLQDLQDIYTVVANVPYYITSKIIFKIIDSYNKFDQLILMVQSEVALRILARPNSSDYSKLSVSLQTLYDIELITHVDASYFDPIPSVNSSVIQLTQKPQPQ